MPERHFLLIRDRHGFERSVPINRTVTLGRQSHCDIVLSDSMVSRTHLKIESVGGEWYAEDLSSSHGTFLQYERLTRAKWEPGATLRIADGAYFLTLKRESSTTSEVHLQAILQTAQLLAEDVDLDEVLEQSLERLLAISNTDRGFIMLLEGGELIPKVQRNLGKELVRDIQLSMSTVHAVFEKGDPIWIHNVGADEKLSSHQSILDLQLKTILCLPLVIQGRRTGVVYLDSRRIITEPVDRATFEAIVSLCAIAIERTRLSEDNLRNQVLATVGQVASSIVHDFKNALFVVRGHAELLEVVSPDPKIHHHSQAILEAVERLSALSMDVLDYAKVREPLRKTLEIGPYLTGIVEPLKQRAKELGVTLDTEGTPCTANLDANRFARVVENLLANALDATAETKGTVMLTWERVTGGVQVRVKDTGKGIPKKVMRRIFEPFYSYGKRKGTGLGMATVKKIVEEHGGSLEVLSEEGQGTTVIMTIPDHGPSAQSSGSSKITGSYDSLKASGEHRRPGSGEHQAPNSGEFKRPDAPVTRPTFRQSLRVGQGFDVHRFAAPEEGRPLVLMGCEIPHDRGLAGHSDADVMLHALMDALLGAAGLGDIGQHFPDTDPLYKDADSMKLLERVMAGLLERGWVVVNADVCLVGERPRISPHRERMREVVAPVLGLDPEDLNIKATTTEQLGFTGRGEGLAALATVLIERATG